MKYRYLIIGEEGDCHFTSNEVTVAEVRKWASDLVVNLETGMMLGEEGETEVPDCSKTYDLWAVDPAYIIENPNA